MTEQPWTRMEIRSKLIEAMGLSPETFSGMTLEEIVQMVGEANRSLRQRIDDLTKDIERPRGCFDEVG